MNQKPKHLRVGQLVVFPAEIEDGAYSLRLLNLGPSFAFVAGRSVATEFEGDSTEFDSRPAKVPGEGFLLKPGEPVDLLTPETVSKAKHLIHGLAGMIPATACFVTTVFLPDGEHHLVVRIPGASINQYASGGSKEPPLHSLSVSEAPLQ